MYQPTNLWASYGYSKSDTNYRNEPIHMELQFEGSKRKNAVPKSLSTFQRLGLQKLRVHQNTIRRLLKHKEELEKERLQYVYRDGIDIALSKNELTDNWSDVADLCQAPKNFGGFDKETFFYQSDYGVRKIAKVPQSLKELPSSRYQSTSANQFQKPHVPSEKHTWRRTKSAPISRTLKNDGKMVSRGTQDEQSDFYEIPKGGCAYCLAECRPLSSSSNDQRSATGLFASPGPCHYQYFHYKKYMNYNRSRSAHAGVLMRKDDLEEKIYKKCYLRIPRFENITQPCTLHNRGGTGYWRVYPSRLHSPTASEQPREVWTVYSDNDDFEHRLEDYEFYDLEHDTVTDQPLKSRDSESIDYYVPAHEQFFDERTQAEGFFNDERPPATSTISSTEDMIAVKISFKDKEESSEPPIMLVTSSVHSSEALSQVEEKELGEVEETVDVTENLPSPKEIETHKETAEALPELHDITQNFPLPDSFTGASTDEEKFSVDSDKFWERPASPPEPSTNMMSGAVHREGLLISPAHSSASDGKLSDPEQASLKIQLPDPLSVKHYPKPEVQTISIVPSREELKLAEIPQYEEDLLPTDRTATVSDGESFEEADETDRVVDKTPSSILKSASQEFYKERKTSRVTFDISTEEKTEHVNEPFDVSSVIIEENLTKKVSNQPLEIHIKDEKKEFADSGKQNAASEKKDKEIVDESPIPTPTPTPTPDPGSLNLDENIIVITTPAPEPQVPLPPVQPTKRFQQDPNDEYLKKLLASPDLQDFVPPVFEKKPPKPKKKGKKKLGSGKKTSTNKVAKKVVETEAEEPLFSYIPKFLKEKEDNMKELKSAIKEDSNELNALMNAVHKYEQNYKEKMKNQPWLFGRMALSKQICRFWLPIDLHDLKGISPSQYLIRYCIVCKRRQKLYATAFDRQLQKRRTLKAIPEYLKKALSIKEAQTALRSVHGNCISEEDADSVFSLLCIDELKGDDPMYVTLVHQDLFINMCAFTERIFYSKFITEDTEDKDSGCRDRLEVADFHGLKWKMSGMGLTRELRKFLLGL